MQQQTQQQLQQRHLCLSEWQAKFDSIQFHFNWFCLKSLTSHKNRLDPSGSYVSASFRFESKFESKVESEVKKDTHIRTKLNENECENKNESGGTCEGGAKRPHVGVFTRFVFVFVVVFVFVFVLIWRAIFFFDPAWTPQEPRLDPAKTPTSYL